jgi:hypothetical protein
MNRVLILNDEGEAGSRENNEERVIVRGALVDEKVFG